MPDVRAEERLLRQTLPDARLSVVQEVGLKASHGRYESRTLWAVRSAALNSYAGSAGTVGKPWPGLAQVCRIQRVVRRRDRKSGRWETTVEVDYSITSLTRKRADAAVLLKRWRVHWHIENRLHWVRDVTLGEDGSAIHVGQGPEVFAILRNAAITLLAGARTPSIAAGVRERGSKPSGVLALFDKLVDRLRPAAGGAAGPGRSGQPSSETPARPGQRTIARTARSPDFV